MRKAAIAESVLSLVTTRERASGIAGDLIESASSAGSLWFWFAVLRTAAALFWRTALGFLLTALTAAVMIWAFNKSATAAHPVGFIATILGWCAAMLWMAAVQSAFRYGLTDRMTQLSSRLAVITVCGVWFRWVPFVPVACGVLAAGIILRSALTARGLRTLSALLFVVVASGIGGVALMGIVSIGLNRATGEDYWPALLGVVGYFIGQALLITVALKQTRSFTARSRA